MKKLLIGLNLWCGLLVAAGAPTMSVKYTVGDVMSFEGGQVTPDDAIVADAQKLLPPPSSTGALWDAHKIDWAVIPPSWICKARVNGKCQSYSYLTPALGAVVFFEKLKTPAGNLPTGKMMVVPVKVVKP